jgi:DNA polymerase-3 subunit delta'
MAWQIIGHEWAVSLLRASLSAGRVAHAYLLSGPPQIGKTTLALTLAQALNCPMPNAPCGQCPSCLKTARRVHPDLQILDGQGVGSGIRIDQIRALQRDASLAPYEGHYRVFILRGMERATIEAANSLLKTLEEPPARVVLVLTAVHPELLPPTVVSRCQRLDLRPVAYPHIETALEARGLSGSQAQLLARLSGGRVGWAFRATEDDTILSQRKQDLDRLASVLTMDRAQRFDFAQEASRDATSQRQLEAWTSWWRDLLLVCSDHQDDVVNVDRLQEFGPLVGHDTRRQAWAVLKALQMAMTQLEANVNLQLVWESLVLRLPRVLSLPETRAVS